MTRDPFSSRTSVLGLSERWWRSRIIGTPQTIPVNRTSMNRRQFLTRTAATVAAGAMVQRRMFAAAKASRAPRILLRGSWQSVNIGDIGHTPGALSLLEKYFPEAEITLWPGNLGHGARELLTSNYPRLKIVDGTLDAAGKPSTPLL